MIKNRKLAQVLLVTASVILISIFVVIVLEKNNLTKLFTNQEVTQQSTETRPVNSVSYTPASTTEQQEGDALKQELINSSNAKTEKSAINITFAFAGQETMGGPLLIEAFVNGASSGNCNFKIVNNQGFKEYSSNIISTGGAYACSRISIPVSDLTSGPHRVFLTVSSGSMSGSAEQQVEVSL